MEITWYSGTKYRYSVLHVIPSTGPRILVVPVRQIIFCPESSRDARFSNCLFFFGIGMGDSVSDQLKLLTADAGAPSYEWQNQI